jgi:hypothetical protein
VFGEGGKALATLEIGEEPRYGERFVRVGPEGATRVVRAAEFRVNPDLLSASHWLGEQAVLWPQLRAEEVSELRIHQGAEDRTITLVRAQEAGADEGEDAEGDAAEDATDGPEEWNLRTPEEHAGKADVIAVQDALRAFTGMRIQDVADGEASPEEAKTYGLETPRLVVTVVPKTPVRGRPPTRLEIGAELPAERGGGAYARKAGAPWVYVVPTSSLDRFRKSPEAFLAPREEPAVAPPGGDTPPDATAPDAGSPDAGSPDAGSPDAGSPDEGSPEDDSPQGDSPDADSPDADSPDADSPDADSPDGTAEADAPTGDDPPR